MFDTIKEKLENILACKIFRCTSFEQAVKHIEFVVNKLKRTGDDELIRVANTYYKWRYKISNAITVKNMDEKRYSNGPAEEMNNAIKTIIKDANGYKNFKKIQKENFTNFKRKEKPLVLVYERSPLLSLQPIEDFYGCPLKSTFFQQALNKSILFNIV